MSPAVGMSRKPARTSPLAGPQPSPQQPLPRYHGPLSSQAALQWMETRLRRFYDMWGVRGRSEQVQDIVAQVRGGRG